MNLIFDKETIYYNICWKVITNSSASDTPTENSNYDFGIRNVPCH